MSQQQQQEHLLVQKIEHKGEELDLSWLRDVVYVESMDLSGPKLMLSMNDAEGILRDDMGIRCRDVLTVTLASPAPQGCEGLDLVVDFVIQTMPVDAGIVKFNCLTRSVDELKCPSIQAQLFVQNTVTQILGAIMPGEKVSVGRFPVVEDYHLLPSMRKSRLIRQMAREMGASAFYCRDELVFRSICELFQAPPAFEYHSNDDREQTQIAGYTQINSGGLIDDRVRRSYQGWNITKGRIRAPGWSKSASESTGLTNSLSLSGLSSIPVPVLDMYLQGNGGLRPGDTLSLVWNSLNLESPLDESLPDKVLIGTVCHRYSSQKYQCRVKGVLPLAEVVPV